MDPLDFEAEFAKTQQPHDAFAKVIFARPERAAALFQQHLPPALAAAIDWPTLQLLPTAFVRKELAQAHSDLLFSVQARGRELRLYLLMEHQSTPDPWMALRLLEYIVEVLREHRAQQAEQPIPVVVPFVLNQGPESWTISTRFAALYGDLGELERTLRPFLLAFEYVLLDLTRFDPSTEERDAANRVALQLMKLARTQELIGFFTWLAQEARAAQLAGIDELLRVCLLYAYNVDVTLDLPKIAGKLLHIPSLRKDAMTLAQKLRQEGREEAREEARQEAMTLAQKLRQEGREEAREEARQEAMTLAQKLRQEGREEARAEARQEAVTLAQKLRQEARTEGREEGEWIGKLHLLEEMMGQVPTSIATLAQLDISELQRRFADLQAQYQRQFKEAK